MAAVVNPGASTKEGGAVKRAAKTWADVRPMSVSHADAMDAHEVSLAWNKMFQLAQLTAPSEELQMAFKLGVYVYGCLNGTSRESSFTGQIVCVDGTTFDAAVIPTACGKMSIRKFYRGCMIESYHALKGSSVMETYERFVARAAAMGIGPKEAFAMADWMKECPLFTPAEARAFEVSRDWALRRSKGARGGKSLEAVESERLDDALVAQDMGSGEHHGRVDF